MEKQLRQDLKQAQLNRDVVKVSTLRLLLSEVANVQIQKGEALSDLDILNILQREVKRRKESVQAFRNGGREELAQQEESERLVLEQYLPEQLSDEELSKLVEVSIVESGARGMSDIGRVIGLVMGKAQGRVEGATVSQLVRAKLSS